jgi:UPF0176 protein
LFTQAFIRHLKLPLVIPSAARDPVWQVSAQDDSAIFLHYNMHSTFKDSDYNRNMTIVNIAAYKFIPLDSALLPDLQAFYKKEAKRLSLKGTILLSTEGINLFLAGIADNIADFKNLLKNMTLFSDLHFKQSFSQAIPFKRLFVKIKKEIITFGIESVKPQLKAAPYITPQQLKKWYESSKNFIMLDTRNQYEVELGSFNQTISLKIDSFKEFAQAVHNLPEEYKEKPIVTCCTGGIRCEKAATYMQQLGFKEVYQLQGGILNYFEQYGGEYYQGECFVFDERNAVDSCSHPDPVCHPERSEGSHLEEEIPR